MSLERCRCNPTSAGSVAMSTLDHDEDVVAGLVLGLERELGVQLAVLGERLEVLPDLRDGGDDAIDVVLGQEEDRRGTGSLDGRRGGAATDQRHLAEEVARAK